MLSLIICTYQVQSGTTTVFFWFLMTSFVALLVSLIAQRCLYKLDECNKVLHVHPQAVPTLGMSYISIVCVTVYLTWYCNRFQPVSTLVPRFCGLRHRYNTLRKQLQRIKEKITESTEACGIILDEESHKDLTEMISSDDCKTVFDNLSKDSFQGIFWKQQIEVLTKNPKSMRWHPLMIRWCLYLRHR